MPLLPSSDLGKLSPLHKQLSAPYALKNYKDKKKNKLQFLKAHKLSSDLFTLLVSTEDTTGESLGLLREILSAVPELPQFHLLTIGSVKKKEVFQPTFSPDELPLALAVADGMMFLPSQLDPSIHLLLAALRFGTVPVAPSTKKVKEILVPFQPLEEVGNSFLYQKNSVWHIVDALVRTKENMRFPYDWDNLVQTCLKN